MSYNIFNHFAESEEVPLCLGSDLVNDPHNLPRTRYEGSGPNNPYFASGPVGVDYSLHSPAYANFFLRPHLPFPRRHGPRPLQIPASRQASNALYDRAGARQALGLDRRLQERRLQRPLYRQPALEDLRAANTQWHRVNQTVERSGFSMRTSSESLHTIPAIPIHTSSTAFLNSRYTEDPAFNTEWAIPVRPPFEQRDRTEVEKWWEETHGGEPEFAILREPLPGNRDFDALRGTWYSDSDSNSELDFQCIGLGHSSDDLSADDVVSDTDLSEIIDMYADEDPEQEQQVVGGFENDAELESPEISQAEMQNHGSLNLPAPEVQSSQALPRVQSTRPQAPSRGSSSMLRALPYQIGDAQHHFTVRPPTPLQVVGEEGIDFTFQPNETSSNTENTISALEPLPVLDFEPWDGNILSLYPEMYPQTPLPETSGRRFSEVLSRSASIAEAVKEVVAAAVCRP